MEPQDTQKSLLQAAQSGESRAWQRLADLYRPLIAGWAARHVNGRQDAEDLAQEILLAVFRALPRFTHNGRRGAFRAWLRTIAVHCTSDHWTARRDETQGSGDSAVLGRLQDLEDPNGELARAWDREHDQFVLNRLLEEVAVEFEPQTMEAFRRVALDDQPAATVAEELNMSVGAVYTGKSRVLQRLRQLSEGLLEWGDEATG